jgi:hypothetical protein
VEEPPVVRDPRLGEQPAHHRERLVEQRGTVAVRGREERPFRRDRRPHTERGQDPLRRERDQRRELSRHQRRVPPGQHDDAAADLQVPGAGHREPHPDERVDHRRGRLVGEPQRVDPPRLQLVDEIRQLGAGTRPGGEWNRPDPHADLHGRHATGCGRLP